MKFENTLFLAGLFSLLITSVLHSQEGDVYMKITSRTGKLVTADKGREDGIQTEWVYDVKRIVKLDTFYVGIAVVQEVEAQTCFLMTFPVDALMPQSYDVLIKNEVLTQSLARTKSGEFWNEIQIRYAQVGALDFIDGRRFTCCKIALKNGDKLKTKNLIVKGDVGVIIPKRYCPEGELIPIEKIESIQTATGDFSLVGAVVGAAASGGMIWLLNRGSVEMDTTYLSTFLYDERGNIKGVIRKPRVEQKDHRLSKSRQILLVVGGYILGSFVGRSFKGLWREIYHADKVPENFSLKWDISQPLPDAIGLNVKIQF